MTGEAMHKNHGQEFHQLSAERQEKACAIYSDAHAGDGWRYVFNQWGEVIGRCRGF